MTKARLARLIRGTFENWNGEGSWEKASSWRKSDWRKLVVSILEEGAEPDSPTPGRPLRADALDENPD